ncbi:Golgi transport complex subunit 1 [Phytophthora boehmeriae]|uniref:Conserved oligomeric Golgi complex subunit 1 n=1 Tax=Phytophthora boehmeriae TaxID=109152 RepID=A0A8T1WYH6_9STRA|nr:Golgi transport complex subunit 1 [Phytophthora boehmeriae]
MAPTASVARSERRAEDTADFLRRLSIADAKVLLERTRKEKENKTKEMQKMIGVRYRDLIESADKIVNMHSAALRLEVSLKEMPEKWKQMELALTSALSVENHVSRVTRDSIGASDEQKHPPSDMETIADKVAFLLVVPEKMWQFLNEGESLRALEIYQQAHEVHSDCSGESAEQEFPFLAAQWTCIQCFRPRMVSCAKSYLTCRGRDSRFYADNLCTLAVLSDPPIGVDKLFEAFLTARSKWMDAGSNYDKDASNLHSRKKRVLMVILKTIMLTVAQTEEIFGDENDNSLLSSIPQLSSTFKEQLRAFVSTGKLQTMLNVWFQKEHRQYGSKGYVTKVKLQDALEEILDNEEGEGFIDEELRRVDSLGFYSLYLVSEIKRKSSYPQLFVNVLHGLSRKYCEAWATILLQQKIEPLRELMQIEQYDTTNEDWIASHDGWIEQVISDEGLGGETDDSSSESEMMALGEEKVWLPWMVQSSIGAKDEQIKLMQHTIRDVLVEQLTIVSVAVYDAAVSLLVEAKTTQKDSVLNFGECCILQFLFDMYFVRATLGFSDFIRFGWGDELNPEECSPGLLKLKGLFERMREFIDPVDWEIYGPQLIENVVLQFRKSRLLFSSLSESNDINKINGKEIVISAQDTRPLARIAEPVARFSLLPVPSSRRRFQRTLSSRSSEDDTIDGRSRANSSTLFHERPLSDDASGSQPSALKLQNLLSSSTSSNIFSAATSGTNLLSSAAKGIGFLSSATSSYL